MTCKELAETVLSVDKEEERNELKLKCIGYDRRDEVCALLKNKLDLAA